LVKGKVVSANCMKTNVELEVQFQSFLTLLPDGGEWWASHRYPLPLRK